jgi:hypothetical protein
MTTTTKRLSRARLISAIAVLTTAILTLFWGHQTQAQGQSILTVILHDSYGKPLWGARVEVLSYDWGLPRGKPYAVIAQGETDPNGVVAFDSTIWPHSGYRFRFSPTDHTRPANTYFMPASENQYRGYPAAVTGGTTEKQFFAIAADGLAYNDLANGQGSPVFDKDPVGGLNKSRVSPNAMSSENYLPTARAMTATAFAEGVPPATIPPPAQPFQGATGPISVTPAALLTPGPTPSSQSQGQSQSQASNGATSTPAATQIVEQPTQIQPSDQSQTTKSDRVYPFFLAMFGVVCFALFWFNRHRLYSFLGLDVDLIPEVRAARARRKKAKTNKPLKVKAISKKSGPSPAPTAMDSNDSQPRPKLKPTQGQAAHKTETKTEE